MAFSTFQTVQGEYMQSKILLSNLFFHVLFKPSLAACSFLSLAPLLSLLFSHHICIFFLLLPLKSFQSTFLFRKWKEGKGKWKRVSLSSDVLFSILMHFLCTVNYFLTLFSCHCPFPRISFYHHFVLNSRLVATSQEEISLPQCRKTH